MDYDNLNDSLTWEANHIIEQSEMLRDLFDNEDELTEVGWGGPPNN